MEEMLKYLLLIPVAALIVPLYRRVFRMLRDAPPPTDRERADWQW